MIRNSILLTFLFALLMMSAVTSGFTYQGRLHVSGDPAQNKYDIIFTLYDAPTSGRAVGSLTHKGVPITNGYFTVELDFGTSGYVFNGQTRWLDVAVRPSDLLKEDWQTLSPRQKIAYVPYARKSKASERLEPPKFIANSTVLVEIEGLASTYFHYFEPIGPSVEVITYQDGTDPTIRKRPGRMAAPNLILKRFANGNPDIESWYKNVRDGKVERRSVRVLLIDHSGSVIDRWNLFHCWPCSIRYDYDRRFETVVMTVEIATEQIDRLGPNDDATYNWQPGPQPVIKGPFPLEIEGLNIFSIDSFSNLGAKTEIVEYQDGDDPILRKRPGQTLCRDTVFIRPAQLNTELHSWWNDVLAGKVSRHSGSVICKDEAGKERFRMNIFECWPSCVQTRYNFAAKAAKEETTIVTESYTYISN